MKGDPLHIISFDNPFPPSYGGAIDVFYRVKALSEAGVRIILHCFYKGELHRSPELEQLCQQVYYYPRRTTMRQQYSLLPYGVVSRMHPDLLPRLLEDEAPILFEGLVSCALMAHPALRTRRKFFRECNVEHDYYHALGRATQSVWKKIFFHIEAEKLRFFERNLRYAEGIFALAHQDEDYFKRTYPSVRTTYIPCFHGNTEIQQSQDTEPFILYHGNLSVSENQKAALYIARHLADSLPFRIIIAGYKPTSELKKELARHQNIELIDSPDNETMERLLRSARIHLLLTFQATGIKLKLLNVLFTEGTVIANEPMVVGTDLAPLCAIGHSDDELIALCKQYIHKPSSNENLVRRQQQLSELYNDAKSAQLILQTIYSFG